MSGFDLSPLVSKINRLADGRKRRLVAIAGPPGSGKSTLAADLVAQLGPEATTLPMDGFHLDNTTLRQRGLLNRKGAPDTFDATGFVNLLRTIQTRETVLYPLFDREADKTVPDAGRIKKTTRIVVVEGNYLLLDLPPWSDLGPVFDLAINLSVSRNLLLSRLIARWRDAGLSPQDARARALGNDMKNADFVLENSRAADITLRSGE